MSDKLIFECIGWLALTLNIWGNLALAKKSIKGWTIRLVCNVAFIIYSYAFSVWPLLANHIIFAYINIYGWHKWSSTMLRCGCGRHYENINQVMRCICETPFMAREKR